ncbi:MAG: Serine phosphatase RsbU, regulator of sigma subunit [Frankiales bacterium]|nr:Serine phosphatase RsbU, regulator of sigma subunit [Frankiales bacterium]
MDASHGDDDAREAVRRVLAAGPKPEHLDRLTRLAAELLEAPRAQVSLLGEQQYVWSLHGGGGPYPPDQHEVGTPLEDSLCTVTARSLAPLEVVDALEDPRVSALPPVTDGGVRAYLGVPLVGSAGVVLGALCVYDERPREWGDRAVRVLSELAHSVVAELELRALAVEAESGAARLELALDASDIGSFDLDPASGTLVWDERLIRLFGYDSSTFTRTLQAFEDRVHPEDRARVAEAVAHALDVSGELSLEYRIVLPDGAVRWVEARGRVLGVKGRRRLLGVAYDSTELRAARDRLSRLLETMTDAFYALDRDWRFTYVNRTAEVLLGRPRDELLGASLWEEFPEAVGSVFEERYRHALGHDEPIAFEAPYAPLDGVYEVSAWPGPDGLSVYFREITERRTAEAERERAYAEREQAVVERERAYASAEAANQRLQLVAAASVRLAASLLPREVLQTLADLVVPGLARWVGVALTAETAAALVGGESPAGDGTQLEVVHVAHASPAAEEGLRDALTALPLSTRDEVGVGAAVRTGSAEWLPQVPDDVLVELAPTPEVLAALRRLTAGSALTLPLVNRGRALGAITIGEPLGDVFDRGLLEGIAGRAAVALDNALLYAQQQRTAVTLQRSLLPRELPVVPGVTVAARYLPGATGAFVGGDWYQGVRVGDRLLLAMGDVMGHGMRSAARMGQLRAIVAALALEGHGPGVLLERLARNVDVLLDLELATLLVAVLDPVDGTLTVASAGHPPPLLAAPGSAPRYVDVDPGPPLGTLPGRCSETVVGLPAGSTLVLYTDGLVEQRDASLDEGLERLRAALEELRLPPEAVADHVLDALGRAGGAEDDVALLVLAWTPEETP